MKLRVEKFGDHWSWEVEREDGTTVWGYEYQLDMAYDAAIHAMNCPAGELEEGE